MPEEEKESFSKLAVPPGFHAIQQIRDVEPDDLRNGSIFSAIGFVYDFKGATQTRGSDAKCTIKIKDLSTKYEVHGVEIVIFWPMSRMPDNMGVGDVVIVRRARVQLHGGIVQLLVNKFTKTAEIHALSSKDIPQNPSAPSSVPWRSFPATVRRPSKSETTWAISANSSIDELDLPAQEAFREMTVQAMNVKDKFSLLQDVKAGRFCDILGQVVKVFDQSAVQMAVYLSDYTMNPLFYNYEWREGAADTTHGSRDGDEYGYNKAKKAENWPGPPGKMTIQLTLFDNHAEYVRDKVAIKDWVLLKNVLINEGKMGGLLEGFLRGDRNAFEGKVRVQIMKPSQNPDELDPRLEAALRRKLDWDRNFKQAKADLLAAAAAAAGSDEKRMQDAEQRLTSKKRRTAERAAKRAATNKQSIGEEMAVSDVGRRATDLNEHIKCSFPNKPIMTIRQMQRPIWHRFEAQSGSSSPLPFINAKYRVNVRVVDYLPARLEDFTIGRYASEYDALPDYSGDDDSGQESDQETQREQNTFAKKTWSWRFALHVEDANQPGDREWLVVGNKEAEYLLDLDAKSLRGDKDTLDKVRQKLSILWGDLEEHKSALLASSSLDNHTSSSSIREANSSPPRKVGEMPAIESDEENDISERPNKLLKSSNGLALKPSNGHKEVVENDSQESKGLDAKPPAFKNKAFACCIKQYGIQVNEADGTKANAGNGKRWERRFGLFDTRIC